jgi:hypothetical protein
MRAPRATGPRTKPTRARRPGPAARRAARPRSFRSRVLQTVHRETALPTHELDCVGRRVTELDERPRDDDADLEKSADHHAASFLSDPVAQLAGDRLERLLREWEPLRDPRTGSQQMPEHIERDPPARIPQSPLLLGREYQVGDLGGARSPARARASAFAGGPPPTLPSVRARRRRRLERRPAGSSRPVGSGAVAGRERCSLLPADGLGCGAGGADGPRRG